MKYNSDYKNELYRKLIHILSTGIPIIYYFTSRELMLSLVGTGALIMIVIDILKAYTFTIEKLYNKIFGSILRVAEKDYKNNLFTGGTYYVLGVFLAIVLFPREVAMFAILVMIWCDTMAALIGMKFGKRKLIGDKSLVGSIAFIVTGVLLIFILQYFIPSFNFYKAGFITVFLAAAFEQLNFLKINDNLSLPVFSGYVFLILTNFI